MDTAADGSRNLGQPATQMHPTWRHKMPLATIEKTCQKTIQKGSLKDYICYIVLIHVDTIYTFSVREHPGNQAHLRFTRHHPGRLSRAFKPTASRKLQAERSSMQPKKAAARCIR